MDTLLIGAEGVLGGRRLHHAQFADPRLPSLRLTLRSRGSLPYSNSLQLPCIV